MSAAVFQQRYHSCKLFIASFTRYRCFTRSETAYPLLDCVLPALTMPSLSKAPRSFLLLRGTLLTTALLSGAQAQCYFRDGSLADGTTTDGEAYVQCPGESFCCTETQYCESNGLCRDKNNHADGSLTDYPGGPYNYTGLYQTSACSDKNWDGCIYECTSGK